MLKKAGEKITKVIEFLVEWMRNYNDILEEKGREAFCKTLSKHKNRGVYLSDMFHIWFWTEQGAPLPVIDYSKY